MARPGILILQQGREKALHNRHPWVFSGALDKTRSNTEGIEPGALVEIRGADGGFLARGYYNPRSQIVARVLSWDQAEVIGPAWWRIRLARAVAARDALLVRYDTDAIRLVNAESDHLPGLIVDRYGDSLVIQALTLGIEVHKPAIIEALISLLSPRGIYERSDTDAREKEGLSPSVGLLHGEAPPRPLVIHEGDLRFPVDVYEGHKTGFYLDQRDARLWLRRDPLVQGADLLNCFSYTGGFAAAAAMNGAASITNVDSSQPMLDAAAETMALNGLAGFPLESVCADVFAQLRRFRDANRSFDLIVLDPPKFAHSQGQVERAARGYKDINMLAFELLNPGGVLLTFSCSGLVSPDLFQKIVFSASADAAVMASITGWFNQPPDHPVALTFPEGHYLKGLVCRVQEIG